MSHADRSPASLLPRRIVLLAYDHMNLLDLAGPLQAFATVNRRQPNGTPPYDLVVVSATGGLITVSAGLPIMTVALGALAELQIDTLIAVGGCKGSRYDAPAALVDWIIERAPTVRRLCSVCTGAFLLAAAQQLDGRHAATHWEWVTRLREQYPQVKVDADKIFIRDGSVWTSAGVTAGIDLALALIEQDHGHRVAIEAARQLVMFVKRSGGQSQFSAAIVAQSHASGVFADLHAWIAANLDEDLRVERLAARAGLSPRTFARRYLLETGQTPASMVESMRLEAARRALEDSDVPLKMVAKVTGHGEEQNLRRVFARHLGISPVQYRSRFSGHAAVAKRLDVSAKPTGLMT